MGRFRLSQKLKKSFIITEAEFIEFELRLKFKPAAQI